MLISLGFSDQVHQICGQLRPDRQTLLFSATLSDRLEAAAGSWLKSPVRIYADPVKVDDEGALHLKHRSWPSLGGDVRRLVKDGSDRAWSVRAWRQRVVRA